MVVRFLARSATISIGDVTIKSDAGSLIVPLRGKGGTISLTHNSDLAFGDISCNYTYSRKITIVNGGSIPSQLSCGWLVVGGATSEQSMPLIQLSEQFASLDPRSQWARQYYCETQNIPKTNKLKPREYWKLINIMIRRCEVNLDVVLKSSVPKFKNLPQKTVKADPSGLRANQTSGFSAYFKKRQMFFHLVASTNLTSQCASRMKPHIKVSPAVAQIPSYGEIVLLVERNLANEDTFLATLSIKSDIPNTTPYEIPLAASKSH